MESSSAIVCRSSSFRKRALEERKSLDMEIESLPTKHERAPSEIEMDVSSSPARYSTTTASNTVMDEIEAHFQRSLAQAKQPHSSTGPPLTPTLSTPPHTTAHTSQPHRPLIVLNNSRPSSEKHPRVTASPPTSHSPPSHRTDHDSHQIVVTLNNHVVTHSEPPTQKAHSTNGIQTHIPVRPVPKTGSPGLVPTPAGFVTIPKTGSTGFVSPQGIHRHSSPKVSPVSTTVQTLPMLTIPSQGGLVNSESAAAKNVSGGMVLSPVLNPQFLQLQQIMTQQSLAFLQQQEQQKRQQQQQLTNIRRRKDSPSSSIPAQNPVPSLIQVSVPATSNSPRGFQIIDLTKGGGPLSQGQSSPKLSLPPSAHPGGLVLIQNDGTLAAVSKATANMGGPLRVVTPSGVPVQPQGRVAHRTNSTLVTATATQPTPAVTTTLLSSPQIIGGQGLSPMVVPMVDPTNSQAAVTRGNQVVFFSAPPTVPTVVQQQPVVLLNPSDLSTLQQGAGIQTVPPAVSMLSPGYSTVPNPVGGAGFILLSPGPSMTMPPLINMNPTNGAPSPTVTTHQQNGSPPQLKSVPPPLKSAQRPKVPPLEPVNIRRTSLDSISPGDDDNDDVMMTPASVEDHFAKALGEQWSKLQTGADFRSSLPRSVQTAQT